MQTLLKAIHIFAGLIFMLIHGSSVTITFRVRRERDREVLKTLLGFSSGTITPMYWTLGALIASGVASGFVGRHWSSWWIWTALGVLAALVGGMVPMAAKYFRRIGQAVGTRPSGAPMASDEELDELLGGSRPMVLAVMGFGGLAVIVWLMVFKPF